MQVSRMKVDNHTNEGGMYLFDILNRNKTDLDRLTGENDGADLEKLSKMIRNRVNNEKLAFTDVFRSEAMKLGNKPDVLSLALASAPHGCLAEAVIIIYVAFRLKPGNLKYQIRECMSGREWDSIAYGKMNIAEDLLGMNRDSLYSFVRYGIEI